MSATISPRVFVTGKVNTPAFLAPKVFISGIERDPAIVKPRVYISAVPKNPAIIKPSVFVSGIPKNQAVIVPKVFITAIDSRETAVGDTLRQVENPSWAGSETAIADTSRRLLDVATADTLRIILRRETAYADTLIRRPHELRYVIQAPARRFTKLKAAAPVQSIVNSFKDYGVTSFEVTLNERTLSDNFSLETAKSMTINDAVKGQLLDYPFSFLIEETSQRDLIQTVKGMYDLDALLYTHIYFNIILGDNEKTLVSAGSYISQVARYLGLTPIVLIQDFIPYHDFTGTNITYSELLNTVFGWTSRLPQRQINIFIRGETLYCIQRGMERPTFDISDLPHSRPTISRKLIRSMWNNPFKDNDEDKDDDDDTPSNSEWIEEEVASPFSGTIQFESNGSHVSMTYSKGLLRSETSRTSNNKIDAHSRTDYTYIEVFPEGTTELEIFLHKLVGDFYLHSKRTESTTIQHNGVQRLIIDKTEIGGGVTNNEVEDMTKIETTSVTEYIYKGTGSENLYLYQEYEGNYRAEYEYAPHARKDTGQVTGFTWELDDEETNDRQTFHIPVGNGWYATSVYLNGEPQGSSLSQGKPGNKISPYTINQVQKTFSSAKITPDSGGKDGGGDNDEDGDNETQEDRYRKERDRLSPIVDTSFPVRSIAMLYQLTDALRWLNRKTQETVNIDITDEIINGVPKNNHIIDFTECVKFNGNEYFLVSNRIRFTPTKLVQSLQLVRWY